MWRRGPTRLEGWPGQGLGRRGLCHCSALSLLSVGAWGLGPVTGPLGEVGVGYCESRPGREFGGLNVAAYLQPHSHSHAP